MATNNTENPDTTESVTITKTTNGDTTNTTITDNQQSNSANSSETTPSSSSSNVDWKNVLDKLLYGGVTLVLIFAFLILASFVASTLGAKSDSSSIIQTSDNDKTNNLFYLLFIVILVILIVAGGLRYLFRTSIYTNVTSDGTTKEFDIIVDHKTEETSNPTPTPTPIPTPVVPSQNMSGEQVFNIPGQYFGYERAQSLCKAYGARLATYSEIESAYENGAEWCNYGWSDGQMALYPTQQKTFDELQKIPGHERDCGRPGVNGGYMANHKLQFGVNCYGKKPAIDAEEQYLMENTPPYPITEKDIKEEEEVNFLKKHINELLVSPFNNTRWSRY